MSIKIVSIHSRRDQCSVVADRGKRNVVVVYFIRPNLFFVISFQDSLHKICP